MTPSASEKVVKLLLHSDIRTAVDEFFSRLLPRFVTNARGDVSNSRCW